METLSRIFRSLIALFTKTHGSSTKEDTAWSQDFCPLATLLFEIRETSMTIPVRLSLPNNGMADFNSREHQYAVVNLPSGLHAVVVYSRQISVDQLAPLISATWSKPFAHGYSMGFYQRRYFIYRLPDEGAPILIVISSETANHIKKMLFGNE